MVQELMRATDIEGEYGIPEGTLKFWRHKGGAGPRWAKLGRRVVYRRADVEQWINDQFDAADRTRRTSA